MADFASFVLEANTGTQVTPLWVPVSAAGELRWSDSPSQDNVSASAWQPTQLPLVTGQVEYLYAFTADAVGTGVLGGGGPPPPFSNLSFAQLRWHWDNVGTFAAAPLFSAWPDSTNTEDSELYNTFLSGTYDTYNGVIEPSYLKGNAFGQVDSVGVPANSPPAIPAITDGVTGVVVPSAGPNWLPNYQGLQLNFSAIQLPVTPAPLTEDRWSVMVALFMGPSLPLGIELPVLSLRYAHT